MKRNDGRILLSNSSNISRLMIVTTVCRRWRPVTWSRNSLFQSK